MESVKDVMYLDPGQEITTRVAFSPANTTARRNYELSISNESVFSALDFGNDITIRAEQPGSTTFYVLLGGYMGGFRLTVRGYTASMAQKEQTLHEAPLQSFPLRSRRMTARRRPSGARTTR